MVGDKRQRAVNPFRSKVTGHALPDEQRFAMLVVTVGMQALGKGLGIEIYRNKGDVIGHWVDDFLQSLQLCFLRGRMIDFKHPRLLDSLDAVRPRIEPGPQDDDLIEPFPQARLEEIVDVAFSGSDELDCTREESSV